MKEVDEVGQLIKLTPNSVRAQVRSAPTTFLTPNTVRAQGRSAPTTLLTPNSSRDCSDVKGLYYRGTNPNIGK